MDNITFDTMPKALAEMYRRLERIEDLLLERSMPEQEPDILNIQQASKLLNLTVPTIYSKVSRRELPFSKRGKKLYFLKTELLAFVKEGRHLTTDEVRTQAIQDTALAMQKARAI